MFCRGHKDSDVTGGGRLQAPNGHRQSLSGHREKKNLVITILYTIFDALFQDHRPLSGHPRFPGYSNT
jgi:hypothetical protein